MQTSKRCFSITNQCGITVRQQQTSMRAHPRSHIHTCTHVRTERGRCPMKWTVTSCFLKKLKKEKKKLRLYIDMCTKPWGWQLLTRGPNGRCHTASCSHPVTHECANTRPATSLHAQTAQTHVQTIVTTHVQMSLTEHSQSVVQLVYKCHSQQYLDLYKYHSRNM